MLHQHLVHTVTETETDRRGPLIAATDLAVANSVPAATDTPDNPTTNATDTEATAKEPEATDTPVDPITGLNDPTTGTAAIQDKPSRAKRCCTLLSPARPLLYIIPIVNALVDTVSTLVSMGAKPEAYPAWFQCIAVPTSFSASAGIGAKFTLGGIGETLKILKEGKWPDWAQVSPGKFRAAIALTAFIGAYVVIADSAQGFYYAKPIPTEFGFDHIIAPDSLGWTIACAAISVITGIGVTFSEVLETFKAVLELLSDEKKKFANTFSKYASSISGSALGFFGAINDMIMSFVGVTEVFGITSLAGIISFATLSIFNGIADASLNGRFIRDEVDALIKFLSEHRPDKTQVVSFIISIAAAAMLAYAWEGLTEMFLVEAWDEILALLQQLAVIASAETFKASYEYVTNPLFAVLGWGGAGSNFATSLPSLYPLLHFLTDKAFDGVGYMYAGVVSCCFAETATKYADVVATAEEREDLLNEDDANAIVAIDMIDNNLLIDEPIGAPTAMSPPLPSLVNNQATLWKPGSVRRMQSPTDIPANEDEEAAPLPRRRAKSRCGASCEIL